jgi:hypothetical protein
MMLRLWRDQKSQRSSAGSENSRVSNPSWLATAWSAAGPGSPPARDGWHERLDGVCVAMRAKARSVVDQLLDDGRAVPWVAEAAFAAATLELAQAGIAALKASEA